MRNNRKLAKVLKQAKEKSDTQRMKEDLEDMRIAKSSGKVYSKRGPDVRMANSSGGVRMANSSRKIYSIREVQDLLEVFKTKLQ